MDEPLFGLGALRVSLSLVVITSILASPALVGAAPNETVSSVSGDRYFPQTGYWISDDTILDYFIKRGGVSTFGYPASRKFRFRGSEVQFFQRRVIQIRPDGSPGQLNILDRGLLEYNVANGATFPSFDPALVGTAPPPGSANYQTALLDWIKQNVPDVWEGVNVNFYEVFLNTVKYEDAYPEGDGNPSWMPGINLEMWGAVTSRPAADPNNSDFIYLRLQRGIMHYDKSSGQTQGLLLGDHLKSVITGQNLPGDLEQKARRSALYRQYDNSKPNGVARPGQLPNTNLKDAFEKEDETTPAPSTTEGTGAAPNMPQYDREAFHNLQDIFQADASLAQFISNLPWLADGVTEDEMWAIRDLGDIAQEDVSLVWLILGFPWLADDLTKDESWAIRDLRDIALNDLEYSKEIAGMTWLRPLHLHALSSVGRMEEARLEQLVEQAWYKDGLTDEEVALILVLSSVVTSEEIFSELMQNGHVRSSAISLFSVGDVNLYAIRRSSVPAYEMVFEVMGTGIQVIEDFMGLPWQKTDVIVFLEPERSLPEWDQYSGINYFTHIVIRDSERASEFRGILHHELAHFYWGSEDVPLWFIEGSAELLAYYTLHVTEQLALTSRLVEAIGHDTEYCKPHGITNIQEYIDATAGQTADELWQSDLADCPYILGGAFLLGMYVELGHEVVSSSLRDIYLMSESRSEPLTEDEIYRVFLANTPSDKQARFHELYQQYHGGPIPIS